MFDFYTGLPHIYIYEKPTVQLASVGSLSLTPVTSLEIEPCNLWVGGLETHMA